MIDANADDTKKLADRVQDLGQCKSPLGRGAAHQAADRPKQRTDEGGRAMDDHSRPGHAAFDQRQGSTVSMPVIDVQLVAKGGAISGLILVGVGQSRKSDRQAGGTRRPLQRGYQLAGRVVLAVEQRLVGIDLVLHERPETAPSLEHGGGEEAGAHGQ